MSNILLPEIGKKVTPTASINDLLNKLPETNKAWQYNRMKMQPYRKHIGHCVDEIIESNFELKKSFEVFKSTLISMSEEYQKIYGKRQNDLINSYAEKQMVDFYSRAGNTLLKELFEIKRDSSLILSGGNSERAEEKNKPPEKNRAGLLKKKYDMARQHIEGDENSEEEKRQGLKLMEEISSDSSYARNYLAFYYYRNRNECDENETKSMEYLKRAYDEDKNMTACYLLGKHLLEKGNKEQARDYIQIAADSGNKYAQFACAKLCKATGNDYIGTKYAMISERNGNENVKQIT